MRRQTRTNVVPYSRSYRRQRRLNMGGPPLPPRRPTAWWRKMADPRFYLRAVILISGLALVGVPLITDGFLAIARPIAFGADKCRVVHVVDGDTADIWCSNTGVERARLVGFDAPELFSPACPTELIAAQKAKWALRGYLFGSGDLRMQRGRLDKYDRRLVTLWLGAVPLSQKMIRGGYARAYGGGARSGWCG